MRVRLSTHLRSNAIAYLALFLALGSTSVAAVSLPRNSVTSPHIKDGQVKRADVANNAINSTKVADASLRARDFAPNALPAGPLGPVGPQGPAGPQGPPGPLDDTRYVNEGQADSVTPAMVVNQTRSVSLPLTSFVDCDSAANAFLDFSSGADAAPDFNRNSATNGTGIALEFDDTAGSEDDFFDVCSQLAVPEDWASGGRVRFRATNSSAPTAPVESLRCRFSSDVLQAAPTGSVPLSQGVNSYTCSPSHPVFGRGSNLTVSIAVTSDSAMNDDVRVLAVEFLYEADS